MKRQYCASAFTLDSDNRILLMYNKKLEKWLQPGGHIEDLETPIEAAIRETFEETGINIEIIGERLSPMGDINPIAIERYINSVGDMIDIQYLGRPINESLNNFEDNKTGFFSISELEDMDVEEEIIIKVKELIIKFK